MTEITKKKKKKEAAYSSSVMEVMCTKKNYIYMRLTAQCNADEQRESPGRTQNRKQMFLNCSMYKNIFTVLSISPFLTRRQAEITDPSCPSQGKWFLSDNYKLASNKNGINFRQNTMINVFFPFPSGCTLEKKKKKKAYEDNFHP